MKIYKCILMIQEEVAEDLLVITNQSLHYNDYYLYNSMLINELVIIFIL